MIRVEETQPNAFWVLIFLCVINFVNSFDTSIIIGAPAQFQYFIQISTGTTDEGALLGMLSSTYITSYAISIPLFGYLTMFMKPFQLISFGLFLSILAALLSGAAKSFDSFSLLLFGRIISGIGGASFRCICQPFIHENAPSSLQTIWMGLFVLVTILGSILGGIASSTASQTTLGWDGVYMLEGITWIPLFLLCTLAIPARFNETKMANTEEQQFLIQNKKHDNNSFLTVVWVILTNKVFMLLSIGSAASAFSSAGIGLLTNLFLIGVGAFASETEVNVQLGFQIVITGIIGTMIGGIVLDYTAYGAPEKRLYYALRQLVIGLPIGIGALLACFYSLPDKTWYIIWNSVGAIVSSAISPVFTTALYEAVDSEHRSLATGVFAVIVHAFGDVPAPIILGYMKDKLAPHCNSIKVDDIVMLNPECKQDKEGLLQGILFSVSFMVWAMVCFGCALFVTIKTLKQAKISV